MIATGGPRQRKVRTDLPCGKFASLADIMLSRKYLTTSLRGQPCPGV